MVGAPTAIRGQIIQEFPLLPPGRGPEGITTGPDGNLWFCEEEGNRIGRQTYPGGVVNKEFVLPAPLQHAGNDRRRS